MGMNGSVVFRQEMPTGQTGLKSVLSHLKEWAVEQGSARLSALISIAWPGVVGVYLRCS